jgi:hypothetical protein
MKGYMRIEDMYEYRAGILKIFVDFLLWSEEERKKSANAYEKNRRDLDTRTAHIKSILIGKCVEPLYDADISVKKQ